MVKAFWVLFARPSYIWHFTANNIISYKLRGGRDFRSHLVHLSLITLQMRKLRLKEKALVQGHIAS